MLAQGTRLSAYEIVAALGAGGMGEVYRARDTKLNRDVAIKILAPEVAGDGDRLARFRREAQVLAALNHPHIAQIYGLEEGATSVTALDEQDQRARGLPVHALVMEFVNGEDLARRIARGAIPLDESLPIASQIAEALEAAHDRNIVHRDLKPSNVMLRSDGMVKVLDFGLAKAVAPSDGSTFPDHGGKESSSVTSPTITSPAMTAAGIILGTGAYMSPEQARGHVVDNGTDIWAFGCVLFEMLTGRRAFDGGDTTETIASILRSSPDWSRLPPDTPESVRRTLRRCLEKERTRRLGSIRDAWLDLDDARRIEAVDALAGRRQWTTRERLLAAALCVTIAVAATVMWRVKRAVSTEVPELRVDIASPPTNDVVSLALSPDGKKLVFVASSDGRPLLWLRSLESGSSQPLRGTEGATNPFWSPDSRSLGFFTNEKLYRLDIDGGAPKVIASAPVGAGGAWNEDDVILYTPVPDAKVVRTAANGGPPMPLPGSNTRGQPGQRFPQFLPDGRHFLYYVAESHGVFLGALDSEERRRLLDADAAAVFAAPAEILFVREGALFAQRFDPQQFQVAGEPYRIAEGIARSDAMGVAAVSGSRVGYIAYRTGSGARQRRLVWFNRSGGETASVGDADPSLPMNLSISSDGRRVLMNRSIEGNTDIWLLDATRNVLSRVTSDAMPDIVPVWSPDGESFLYSKFSRNRQAFGLYRRSMVRAGEEAMVFQSSEPAIALDWSRDSRLVLYRTMKAQAPEDGWDIWAKPLEDAGKPFPIAQTRFDERAAEFSPDTRWIAYESNESGRFEIYVQPFPGPGAKVLVSNSGGSKPRWRSDGRELFYIAADSQLMAVPVRLPARGERVEVASPVPLFSTRIESTVQGGINSAYVVSADGQRFLMSVYVEQPNAPIALILNRSAR